jgi:hypothetical protein
MLYRNVLYLPTILITGLTSLHPAGEDDGKDPQGWLNQRRMMRQKEGSPLLTAMMVLRKASLKSTEGIIMEEMQQMRMMTLQDTRILLQLVRMCPRASAKHDAGDCLLLMRAMMVFGVKGKCQRLHENLRCMRKLLPQLAKRKSLMPHHHHQVRKSWAIIVKRMKRWWFVVVFEVGIGGERVTVVVGKIMKVTKLTGSQETNWNTKVCWDFFTKEHQHQEAQKGVNGGRDLSPIDSVHYDDDCWLPSWRLQADSLFGCWKVLPGSMLP